MSEQELRVTVEFICKVTDPDLYGEGATPQQMAEIDERNFRDDPSLIAEELALHPFTVTVTAVDNPTS